MAVLVATRLGLPACAHPQRPADDPLTAEQHRAVAVVEEAAAARLAARFDPHQSGGVCQELLSGDPIPCWRSNTNPTVHYLIEATAHRKKAAHHRKRAAEMGAPDLCGVAPTRPSCARH